MSEVGVTPAELAQRVAAHHSAASPAQLHDWLLAAGLAVEDGGLLVPTETGRELAAALVPNGRELRGSISPLLHR